MKTKVIILFSLLALTMGELSGQNWSKISKEIKEKQLTIEPLENRDINCYYKLREKTNILNEMKLNHPIDTIFILQIHREVYLSSSYLMIWNKNDTLSINSEDFGKTVQITNQQTFISYMMKLVADWNLDEIKKEELTNGIRPSDGIFATRIIVNSKKCQIDCLYFKNFFNMQRDGMDFCK